MTRSRGASDPDLAKLCHVLAPNNIQSRPLCWCYLVNTSAAGCCIDNASVNKSQHSGGMVLVLTSVCQHYRVSSQQCQIGLRMIPIVYGLSCKVYLDWKTTKIVSIRIVNKNK